MKILENIKSWFKQDILVPLLYIDKKVIAQIEEQERSWFSKVTIGTPFEGMTEKQVDELMPIYLKVNIMGSLSIPEVLQWYKHFLTTGAWPTTEEAYFMRYLKGNHKKIPFHILRKFIMEDAGLSPEYREIKLWSHR